MTRVFLRRDIGVIEILLTEDVADRLRRASRVGGYSVEHAMHAILHHGLTVFEKERFATANTNAARS